MKREKWCRSRVCLRDKVAAFNSTVAASATLSRDKVAHSCDKIARVTSVLNGPIDIEYAADEPLCMQMKPGGGSEGDAATWRSRADGDVSKS